MAVYTEIPQATLEAFVGGFDIGALTGFTGIAEGVENTNYRVDTTGGRFVLTLFERRAKPSDLPYFIGLMDHLARRGVPCPVPVRNREGAALHTLVGRPATLVTFLDGDWPRRPGPAECEAAGAALATLHLAGRDYPSMRDNNLSVDAWPVMYAPLRDRAEELRAGLATWIDAEIQAVENAWPEDLPFGVIHADLFPDNVFFLGDTISGIIDLYFACNDFFAYDIAICLNAWCFDDGGNWLPDNAEALLRGYEQTRALEDRERAAMPVLARGAAMRFLLTRLHDWFETPAALGRRKDPLAFLPVIAFHTDHGDDASYRAGQA